MRPLVVRVVVSLLVLFALPLTAQLPEREELMKKPQRSMKNRKPTFAKLSAEEVRKAITVTSARNSALFGFNDSAVRIHMPRVDNSNWIEDEFTDPQLFDEKQNPVKYEKEQGIYDHERYSTEIRFAGLNRKPVEFARAKGSVRIKYPAVMKTVSLKKSETAKGEKVGVIIDGPFVKTDLAKVPEASFASPLEGIRAYDSEDQRLERVMGYSSSSWENDVSYRGYAFHGEVARVDFDVVEEWVTLQIDYDMPPAPKHPNDRAGSSSRQAPKPTEGGHFEVKIVPNE